MTKPPTAFSRKAGPTTSMSENPLRYRNRCTSADIRTPAAARPRPSSDRSTAGAGRLRTDVLTSLLISRPFHVAESSAPGDPEIGGLICQSTARQAGAEGSKTGGDEP